ncbi:MAG: Hsp20/alpha crystallin family protein [Acidimicrobiales bacterium]
MSIDQPTHQEVLDSTAETERTMEPQTVAVNVYESSTTLVVLAPMPAVQPQDVTVELRPGQLRFWAHVRSSGPRQFLIHEWEYGGFERELELPDGYGGQVEATLANGQLAIRVHQGSTTEPIIVHPEDPTHAR